MMDEERQWPVAGKRFDPESHLRQLHRSRVEVHPIEAMLDDPPLAPGRTFFFPTSTHFGGKCPVRIESLRRVSVDFSTVGFVELSAQKPRCAYKEVGRAAGKVDDTELLNLCRRLTMDERIEGFADQIVHDRRRRVVRPARLSGRAGLKEKFTWF